MDSFIKIVEQKKEEPVATLHTKQIDLLKKYIQQKKNVFICGSTGVGKTYVLKSVLNEWNSVEIEKEHLSLNPISSHLSKRHPNMHILKTTILNIKASLRKCPMVIASRVVPLW